MSARRMQQLEERLMSVCCPTCHHALQNLVLRCDAFMGSECLALSHCEHCGAWVDVEETPTVAEEFRETAERMALAGCPTCRSREVQIEYRCDLASRECFYEVTCSPGGHRHRA